MWKLAVFDLDGTLVDSRDDIAASAHFAMRAVAALEISVDRFHPYIGASLRRMFAELSPGLSGAEHDEMVEVYKKRYFDHCHDRSCLFPDVAETLDAITGLPRAIATTKRTFMARRVASLLDLERRFDLVQGTDEGTPVKPAPHLIQLVMKHFGAAPENTLVVGDTDHDVLAAKAAGCRVAAVTYGIRSGEELAPLEPDWLVDRFSDLGPILRGDVLSETGT